MLHPAGMSAVCGKRALLISRKGRHLGVVDNRISGPLLEELAMNKVVPHQPLLKGSEWLPDLIQVF